MDPLLSRLGRLIRSQNPFRSSDSMNADQSSWSTEEQEAFDELEAELNGRPKPGARGYEKATPPPPPPQHNLPPGVVKAYRDLGLPATATWNDVCASHRSLLKQHHPDRFAGDPVRQKQATERSQGINESYQVIKKHMGR